MYCCDYAFVSNVVLLQFSQCHEPIRRISPSIQLLIFFLKIVVHFSLERGVAYLIIEFGY